MNKILIFIFAIIFFPNLNQAVPRVAVFCSADNKASDSLKMLARDIGIKLGEHAAGLVTGGSKTGLMKEVIDGYLSTAEHAENMYGVIPSVLKEFNVHHTGIFPSHLLWVDTMHTRLATFHELSDIVVILPGGFGTLHELMDFLVAKQFAIINKPIILVNYEHFWDKLLKLFNNMQTQNLLAQSHKNIFTVVSNAEECIRAITTLSPIEHAGLESLYWEK